MRFAIFLIFVISGCSSNAIESNDVTFPKIGRHPESSSFCSVLQKNGVPAYNPKTPDSFAIDLRRSDLSNDDLRDRLADLNFAKFGTTTIWPTLEMMPNDFDPTRIIDDGKNPGLGIHKLHAAGIDGRGVGIAIIDQTLLTDHQEIKHQLRFYEEIGAAEGKQAAMHGIAVASLAVGKTIGVAPNADLYFLAVSMQKDTPECNKNSDVPSCLTYLHTAKALNRILEINNSLPANKKIRVVSISRGFSKNDDGYQEMIDALNHAKAQNIFVITTSLRKPEEYSYSFAGAGRSFFDDPELASSYRPGLFWEAHYIGKFDRPTLLVPTDSRTVGSFCGIDQYLIGRIGGMSWSVPYLAGLYALAVQVKPDINPEIFWNTALDTGSRIEYTKNGQTMSLEKIVNPYALIMKASKIDISADEFNQFDNNQWQIINRSDSETRQKYIEQEMQKCTANYNKMFKTIPPTLSLYMYGTIYSFIQGIQDEFNFSRENAERFRNGGAPRPINNKQVLYPKMGGRSLCHEVLHHYAEANSSRQGLVNIKWFDEGSAQYFSAQVYLMSLEQDLTYVRSNLADIIPVEKMIKMEDWSMLFNDPASRKMSYAQATLMFDYFIKKFGEQGYLLMLEKMKTKIPAQAFGEVTGMSFDEFFEGWKQEWEL